jgi:hypothetical protein
MVGLLPSSVHQLNGYKVEFTDGSCEEFDLIVCATGYLLPIRSYLRNFSALKDKSLNATVARF